MADSARFSLIPLDDALARLLASAQPVLASESIATTEADGRVLAQDVMSALTVPPCDNSAMDGYAVRAADCAVAGAELAVTQRIPAGGDSLPLIAGTAARIFTGAPIPPGADAVVMQEQAVALETQEAQLPFGRVRIEVPVTPGRSIRRAGEDIRAGDVVLAAGERLTPAALGLAASVGLGHLQVACRPRVALLSTGDELVMPGEVPPEAMRPGAIYNSNRFFIRALLQRTGCDVSDLSIVPDRLEATVEVLRTAAVASDLIVTTGGVSVGEEDHVKTAMRALGQLQLWSLSMKPGKPFAYGRIGKTHVCGLPGNPVSSFMTFLMLVRPFLLRLQGATRVAPRAVAMRADFDWPRPDRRREFLRVRINDAGGLDLFPNQGSGVLTSTVWGDGVVDNPGSGVIRRGDMVRFVSFAEFLC